MKKKLGVVAAMLLILVMCAGTAMAEQKPVVAQTAFAKMDTDGNGEITIVEHKAFWKSRFADLDANKDGKLSAEEFVKGITGQTPGGTPGVGKDKALLAQQFVVYWCGPDAKVSKETKPKADIAASGNGDANKDGKIDKDECVAIWFTHFNAMDTDKDGKVTMDEYVSYLKKRFKELDKNGDGYIVAAEYDYYWSGTPATADKKK